jgi:hypothetical protein
MMSSAIVAAKWFRSHIASMSARTAFALAAPACERILSARADAIA